MSVKEAVKIDEPAFSSLSHTQNTESERQKERPFVAREKRLTDGRKNAGRNKKKSRQKLP